MIKIKNILSSIFVASILFGCGEFEPNVDFAEPIKGRTINLSNKVGESFQIVRGNDTIKYSLYFDKSTDYNYLVKSDTDTVFIGTVTKRNELFLLNRPLKNEKFAIHALLFTDSTVTGLETEWLQSSIIKSRLDSGQYVKLIADTVGVNTIQAKKKDGKEIFRFVIEQLEPEKLISYELDYSEKDTLIPKSENQIMTEIVLIKKVYPNPFTDNITIELSEKAPYIFKVFDINGKHIKTSKLNTDNMKMELPNLKSGYYILKILSLNSELLDEIKLVKK
ncbi:T9SS type A sorting domain-containing protein [Brumimicrobium glaciale]|nr:T9SS type A sorting domain-containing protein [Brumimicrobium glaciale]